MGDLSSADFRSEAARASPQYASMAYALMRIAEAQEEMVIAIRRLDKRLEILTGVLEDWKREVT